MNYEIHNWFVGDYLEQVRGDDFQKLALLA